MKNIEIIRSDRRTVSVEVRGDMRVIVRAPRRMKKEDIQKFIDSKREWIDKHLEKMKQRSEAAREENGARLTTQDINELASQALKVIPPLVAEWAKRIGVTYKKVTIRNQKTRWGSCSSTGNLNFNCLLMLCPPDVMEYVVIHELCHRKHMNHSKEFWALVENYCPSCKMHRKWLKEKGGAIIRRMEE